MLFSRGELSAGQLREGGNEAEGEMESVCRSTNTPTESKRLFYTSVPVLYFNKTLTQKFLSE